MLYELRVYEILPGRMDAIMARFSQHTMRIFERLDIEVVGFWQEVVGRSDRWSTSPASPARPTAKPSGRRSSRTRNGNASEPKPKPAARSWRG